MLQITLTIEETPEGHISLRNQADGSATDAEVAFALKFRDMMQREMPKLYAADEATCEQVKASLDVQRFTQN